MSGSEDFTAWRERFLSGAATPVTYLERQRASFLRREPDVHAFVHADWDRAAVLADQSAQRYRHRRPLSPIDGLPFAIKDIIETADLPTEMGSPIFSGFQARRNAACVMILIEAGAVPVGKTVTQEFACGVAGPTRNPRDPARTPGGSSSGSAAAVAAGMVPVALGTQTRASTIRPASYCGVYGLKPTYGLIPVEGVHPVAPSHDTVGILAGSLRDLVSAFYALIGQVETSATAVPPRKLLVIRTPGFDQIDEPTRLAFEAMLSDARSQFAIDDWRSDAGLALDALFTDADTLLLDIMGWEIQWPYGDYEGTYGTLLSQDIRGLLARGRAMGKQRYLGLLKRKAEIQSRAAAIAKSYGAVLTLSASGVAPVAHDFTGSRSFPIPWSLVGGPSLSAPLLSVEGLPVGVQIMGLPGREKDVFEISQTLAACVTCRALAQAP